MRYSAVLFDLDGTLIDSAPDLVAIVNRLLGEEGRAHLPYSLLRSYVSEGAVALIKRAFGEEQSADELKARRDRFLADYTADPMCYGTRLFEGVEELTTLLDEVRWGIVTNKNRLLTELIVEAIPFLQRAQVLVCGGDLEHLKPNPAPVLKACKELGVPAAETLFVGDNIKDVLAGRQAGVTTIAVLYGYYREDPQDWQAHYYVTSPALLGYKLRELLD